MSAADVQWSKNRTKGGGGMSVVMIKKFYVIFISRKILSPYSTGTHTPMTD